VSESDVERLTKRTFRVRELGSGTVLIFLVTPLFVGLFRFVLESDSAWTTLAAYAVLFLWGLVVIVLAVLFVWGSVDFLPWPKRAGASTSPKHTGWNVGEVKYQASAGIALIAVPLLLMWLAFRPAPRPVDVWAMLPQIVLTWTIVAPVETWLQAWTWPMVLPYGPISAQAAFVLLHGERALDPAFALYAFFMGLAFWSMSYARYRYANRKWARWFGPLTASSAHATLNTVLMFLALEWPKPLGW